MKKKFYEINPWSCLNFAILANVQFTHKFNNARQNDFKNKFYQSKLPLPARATYGTAREY